MHEKIAFFTALTPIPIAAAPKMGQKNADQWTESYNWLSCPWPAKCLFCKWLQSNVVRLGAEKLLD